MANRNRKGDNLFTASIVALNADTGKMVWYHQSSPHDTHDWDATQTGVLIDDELDGRPRNVLAGIVSTAGNVLLREDGRNGRKEHTVRGLSDAENAARMNRTWEGKNPDSLPPPICHFPSACCFFIRPLCHGRDRLREGSPT
jgi:glucose dehydrogenase